MSTGIERTKYRGPNKVNLIIVHSLYSFLLVSSMLLAFELRVLINL